MNKKFNQSPSNVYISKAVHFYVAKRIFIYLLLPNTYFFQIVWNNFKIMDLIRETNKGNFRERKEFDYWFPCSIHTWQMRLTHVCNIKQLMHYLSSVYFFNQPLCVSGIFIANQQEIYSTYTTTGTCCIYTVYLLLTGYKYARNT
jgi:hypothetical protein